MEVKIDKLVKIFDSKRGGRVVAVNNMTFDIPDGKLCGLLGPSGCGKSTTLYMIAGLHKLSEGHIYFGNEDVTNVPAENRGIGLVFQNYALYPHLNVRQNIMFPLDNVRPKLSYDEKCAIALENAKIVNIEKLLDRKPKELSGGQQQRVAIARALAKRPKVLLLDEPLSNLDARLRLQTREEIKRIQKQTGITTIFVTHDQEEAMSISDFIVVMKDGIVQQKDEPQKVYEEPANLFVAKFLGTPAINVFDGRITGDSVYLAGKEVKKDASLKKVHIEELICPHCGTVVSHNAKYCNICGANLLSGNETNKKAGAYNLNKKIKLEELEVTDINLAKKLFAYLNKFDTQDVIDIFMDKVKTLASEEDVILAKDSIEIARAKAKIERINSAISLNKPIIEEALSKIDATNNASSKEGVAELKAIVTEAYAQVDLAREQNLLGSVTQIVGKDNTTSFKKKVIAYLNKYDNIDVINYVNENIENVCDLESLNNCLANIEILRAKAILDSVEVSDALIKEFVKSGHQALDNMEKAYSKDFVTEVHSVIRKTLNAARSKDYADHINSIYKENDWELTKKIKQAQLDMIYNIDDVTAPESKELINKIISSLEHRLNPERDCKIGIRAESFELDENGPIEVLVNNIEHIGRDISVIGEISMTHQPIKIIISSELAKECEGKSILHFRPKRIYVFEETGERIL